MSSPASKQKPSKAMAPLYRLMGERDTSLRLSGVLIKLRMWIQSQENLEQPYFDKEKEKGQNITE